MIREHTVKVTPSNKKSRYAVVICLLLSVVSMLVYSSVQLYRGLIGIPIIVFLTAGIYIYQRYVSAVYYYGIGFDSDGVAVFTVVTVTGKRSSTLCRVSLKDITSVTAENAEERRKHSTPYGTRKYVYVPTLLPTLTHRVVTASRYEKAEIVIECSSEYAEMLLAYSKEAKAISISEEDEY